MRIMIQNNIDNEIWSYCTATSIIGIMLGTMEINGTMEKDQDYAMLTEVAENFEQANLVVLKTAAMFNLKTTMVLDDEYINMEKIQQQYKEKLQFEDIRKKAADHGMLLGLIFDSESNLPKLS